MKLRSSRLRWLIAPILPTLLVLAACTGEGEGAPCDPNAGSVNGDPPGTNDCNSPLKCTALNAGGAHYCCPQDLSTATAPACTIQPSGNSGTNNNPPDAEIDTGASTVAESSVSETGADATAESDGSDATPSDATSPVDAPVVPDAPADALPPVEEGTGDGGGLTEAATGSPDAGLE